MRYRSPRPLLPASCRRSIHPWPLSYFLSMPTCRYVSFTTTSVSSTHIGVGRGGITSARFDRQFFTPLLIPPGPESTIAISWLCISESASDREGTKFRKTWLVCYFPFFCLDRIHDISAAFAWLASHHRICDGDLRFFRDGSRDFSACVCQ